MLLTFVFSIILISTIPTQRNLISKWLFCDFSYSFSPGIIGSINRCQWYIWCRFVCYTWWKMCRCWLHCVKRNSKIFLKLYILPVMNVKTSHEDIAYICTKTLLWEFVLKNFSSRWNSHKHIVCSSSNIFLLLLWEWKKDCKLGRDFSEKNLPESPWNFQKFFCIDPATFFLRFYHNPIKFQIFFLYQAYLSGGYGFFLEKPIVKPFTKDAQARI